MGVCTSKPKCSQEPNDGINPVAIPVQDKNADYPIAEQNNNAGDSVDFLEKKREVAEAGKKSPFFPFYSPSPAHYLFWKKSPVRSPAQDGDTPRRFFKRPFHPPSPAKHIRAVLALRHGTVKPNGEAVPDGKEVGESDLDKSFGFGKKFHDKYELGGEVGRGHLGTHVELNSRKESLKGRGLLSRSYLKLR